MDNKEFSFNIGTSVAQYMMQYGVPELDYNEFKRGIEFVLNASKEAKQKGEAFLAENAKRQGVKTTASGLQYKILTAGTGDIPTATDRVKVNYEGRLIDGTVFDSSYKRNQPATFACNQVIKGWTEALTMMPVGSKWQLYIPYELAYGERGAGEDIKPYSALIFDVELVDIIKK